MRWIRAFGFQAALCGLTFASCAHAQVYRCTVDGKAVYSDVPCVGGAEKIELRKSNGEADAGAVERAKLYELISAGRVGPGMTPSDVRASWGSPSRINRTVSVYGNTEQWVYDRGRYRAQYVYFTDGKVTSVSD